MQNRKPQLLLHPFFIIALLFLLLNDFFWKYEYPGWITGKLSDFSGLFVFTVFLRAVLSVERKLLILFVTLFFIWWKSPLSENLIDLIKNYPGLNITRVQDYTDLLALFILPFAGYLKPLPLPNNFLYSTARNISLILSLFAFCFTTLPRQLIYYPYRDNEVLFNAEFSTRLSEQEVLARLRINNSGYQKDSVRFYRVLPREDLYFRLKNQPDSSLQWVKATNSNDSALYVKVSGHSYYTLPIYIIDRDTLYQLEFSVYPNSQRMKKTTVKIESFQLKYRIDHNDYMFGKPRKKIKRHFKSLFQ